MADWTDDELKKVGKADELEIISMRQDGSLRKPVTIWVVRVGDNLYVRAVRGRNSAWFRGTQTCHAGRIQAGGVDKEVNFIEEKEPKVNIQIDQTYRSKYGHYSREYVDPMIEPTAREATLKLEPR